MWDDVNSRELAADALQFILPSIPPPYWRLYRSASVGRGLSPLAHTSLLSNMEAHGSAYSALHVDVADVAITSIPYFHSLTMITD